MTLWARTVPKLPYEPQCHEFLLINFISTSAIGVYHL